MTTTTNLIGVHLSGTGAPESTVTAPPGSTFTQTDSTTTASGWLRWVKATGTGSTGWVAGADADTGWRDITGSLLAPATTKYPNLVAFIRRLGNIVEIIGYCGTGTTDGAAGTTLYNLPVGFRAQTVATYRSPIGSTMLANSGAPSLCGFYIAQGTGVTLYQPATAGAGNNVQFTLTYMIAPGAAGVWPTSLPGTAI